MNVFVFTPHWTLEALKLILCYNPWQFCIVQEQYKTDATWNKITFILKSLRYKEERNHYVLTVEALKNFVDSKMDEVLRTETFEQRYNTTPTDRLVYFSFFEFILNFF